MLTIKIRQQWLRGTGRIPSKLLARRSCSSLKKSNGPLRGLKVLDLTRVLAGPFCTQILADYGADVIKIEQPGTGDETRTWRSQAESSRWKSETMSMYFAAVNRNKRSVTLNLKKPEAIRVIYELAESCDIFIENFTPGKADSLGLSFAKLSSLNPRLIYASISGYGSFGPCSKRAGYDAIAAAEGGLMHVTGFPDGPPMRPGLGMTDMSTGLLTHGAILAALHSRHQTGCGQYISTSLFETQLSLLINVGMNYLNLGQDGGRFGAAHPSIVPYNTYQTRDGRWLALGANNDRQFRTFCKLIGQPDMAENAKFATNTVRVQNREECDTIVNGFLKSKTLKDWLTTLDGSGLAHGPVNSIGQALSHPQSKARKMVQQVACEGIDGGALKIIGPPVKFSGTEVEVRTSAPELGEHTDAVLGEIGYNNFQIRDYREQGVL